MSKKLKVILSICVVVLVVLLSLPFYMGVKAKHTLERQHALLQESVIFDVVEHHYSKGWFSSEETTSVRLKPSIVAMYKNLLPEPLRVYSEKTVTYTNHIFHGPFPKFQHFGRAYVETEFYFSNEIKEELKRFFKDQEPIVLRNNIDFSGGGKLELTVPKFDYSELSGIKINWQGLTYTINYKDDFSDNIVDAIAPGLDIILADKGNASFKNLKIDSDNQLGKTGASLGKNSLTLEKLDLSWTEGVDYYINVNELISFLSDVQVGAFINPRGKLGPAKLELDNFSFNADLTEQDENFLNWKLDTTFDRLAYDKDIFGPMQVKVTAKHFDGKSFLSLTQRLKEIATQELTSEDARTQIIHAAKKEGLGLFTHNPQIDIEVFKLKMPSGMLDINGSFALLDVKKEDLDDPFRMIAKMNINMEGYIPQEALESIAIGNAQAIFKPDERVEDQPDMDDIAEGIRVLVQGEISSWEKQGLVQVKDGVLFTKIEHKEGNLFINGRKLVFKEADDESLFDNEESSAPISSEEVGG